MPNLLAILNTAQRDDSPDAVPWQKLTPRAFAELRHGLERQRDVLAALVKAAEAAHTFIASANAKCRQLSGDDSPQLVALADELALAILDARTLTGQ